jgi:hypothetical protein
VEAARRAFHQRSDEEAVVMRSCWTMRSRPPPPTCALQSHTSHVRSCRLARRSWPSQHRRSDVQTDEATVGHYCSAAHVIQVRTLQHSARSRSPSGCAGALRVGAVGATPVEPMKNPKLSQPLRAQRWFGRLRMRRHVARVAPTSGVRRRSERWRTGWMGWRWVHAPTHARPSGISTPSWGGVG